jgi:hypothetical protein
MAGLDSRCYGSIGAYGRTDTAKRSTLNKVALDSVASPVPTFTPAAEMPLGEYYLNSKDVGW